MTMCFIIERLTVFNAKLIVRGSHSFRCWFRSEVIIAYKQIY